MTTGKLELKLDKMVRVIAIEKRAGTLAVKLVVRGDDAGKESYHWLYEGDSLGITYKGKINEK